MYRKLVKLDPNNGWSFGEVDLICVRRAAAALKDYIDRCIDPDNDPYEIRGQILPLCEGTLDGSLNLPLIFADLPLKYPSREGLLPESFEHYWSMFSVPATGTPLEEPQEILIEGERYAYMDFEDAGDWPEVVAEYAEERQKRRRREWRQTEEERRLTAVRAQERRAMLQAEEERMAEQLKQKRLRQSQP